MRGKIEIYSDKKGNKRYRILDTRGKVVVSGNVDSNSEKYIPNKRLNQFSRINNELKSKFG